MCVCVYVCVCVYIYIYIYIYMYIYPPTGHFPEEHKQYVPKGGKKDMP